MNSNTILSVALVIAALILAFGAIGIWFTIGKPRTPMTPVLATWISSLDSIITLLILVAAHKLR